MTKADIVASIAEETGLERSEVLKTVEAFMTSVKDSLAKGENVYLRGFGSFIVKERAEKTGRNISKNTTIIIPAHNIPSFKPAKTFVEEVKNKVVVK
jgi:DNA-binding protein HU-beta